MFEKFCSVIWFRNFVPQFCSEIFGVLHFFEIQSLGLGGYYLIHSGDIGEIRTSLHLTR